MFIYKLIGHNTHVKYYIFIDLDEYLNRAGFQNINTCLFVGERFSDNEQ